MTNYMVEVAKILGVELDEEFDICFDNNCVYMKAKLTENGFKVINTNMVALVPNSSGQVFEWILCGLATIKRKPWKPERDERFYVVTVDGRVMFKYWDDCSTYKNYYKLGNFYRTYEEAETNRDKWLAFYQSDEVLEV